MQIKNLDEIDQQIIKLLAENARMSYVEIGNRVNLSRVAVKSRVEVLEREGVIEKYTIIVNPEKIGRGISAYVDIETDPRYLYEIAEQLAQKECVTDLYHMTGSSNLHLHIILGIQDDLQKFLKDELYSLRGMKKVDCKLILSRIKSRKGIRL